MLTMVNSSSGGGGWKSKDKTKEWQMEMLMEKLRSKAGQFRTFQQAAKDLRMALLEKRYPLDSIERSQLQKCLDTLQQNIKVTSHQAMVERLDSVSRQLGLKLVRPTPSGLDCFISSDMFYLEILLEADGSVKDVKINHEGRGEQSCEELVKCLTDRNFADLSCQLEGLASIYQLNAEKKVKCKAFSALTSLETDLSTLASLHQPGAADGQYLADATPGSGSSEDLLSLVYNSPVGLVERRKGGHPMKLTFFVSPYDLLDPITRGKREVSSETLAEVGHSVSVCMESSSGHKLQTSPIVTITRVVDGNAWPLYGGLSAGNSITLAGSFVLRLKQPMPVCLALVSAITAATGADCADVSSPRPLLSLVTQVASQGKADNRGLFVNVGDQQHCYLMTEARGLEGVLVSSIPFTHPSHIPQVLACLRQQALFNTVISSCVRPSLPQDIEKMIMLEVMPLDWQHLSVTLEHPLEESMATVELDLTDINSLSCKVYTSSGESVQANSDYATKVFQRSMSIPVTMRSLIKLWNAQGDRLSGGYNGGGGPEGGGGSGGTGGGGSDFDPDIKIKLEPGLTGLVSRHGSFASDGADPSFDQFSSSIDSLQFQELGQSLGLLDGLPKCPRGDRSPEWGVVRRSPGGGGESSSGTSSPLGTPTSGLGTGAGHLDLTGEPAGGRLEEGDGREISDKRDELEIEEAMGRVPDIDVEEIYKGSIVSKSKSKKSKEEKKIGNEILLDFGAKNYVPPSVSITPITNSQMNQNYSSVLSGMGLERRPGIEIIPITPSTPTSVTSSITITPIPSSKTSEERSKEKKSSRSKDEKLRLEKKRKRKKEDSPMGPPEKIPSKSDPLSKPVSVCIKPADSSSPRPSSPSGSIRKYSTSPTPRTSPLTVGKSSPGPGSKSSKQPSPSPKHSPHYSTSSPKNPLTSSPKHSTSSPKHQSSSGKPSMSTLKSAVGSPSKSDSKSKSKESRDKDRKSYSSSSGHSSPKLKSPTVKLKQLDITSMEGPQSLQSGGSTPPGSGDGGKSSSSSGQSKNRKGSLSAIVDKLKLQQSDEGNGKEKKEKERPLSNKVDSKNLGKPGENKPGEYMVKPSSDGMKLTINKTKSKESSKVKSGSSSASSSPSNSGSPKTLLGSKAGGSSGSGGSGASGGSTSSGAKKSHSSGKSSSPSPRSSSSSSTSKSSSKSSSSSATPSLTIQKTSKPSGSPKMSDPNKSRDKPRIPKLPSFSGKESRKLSPSSLREDDNYKLILSEGLVVKQLDTKFQIPKLSSRSSNIEDKKEKPDKLEIKAIELANKLVAGSKNSDDLRVSLVDPKTKIGPSTTISLGSTSPMSVGGKVESESPNISIIPMNLLTEKEKDYEEDVLSRLKIDIPLTFDLDEKKKDCLLPSAVGEPCSSEEAAELLLDFSASKEPRQAGGLGTRGISPLYSSTDSPSVLVNIMKSPVPRDRAHLSPHSSPGIATDDELMDEALVGGK